ncbi:MAG: ADP-ribosylglycohydrolase family protein [Nitrospirota bacterium]|nr:ADP-ribosylglycohydrolase family protein [Nitrospirota bacterium]
MGPSKFIGSLIGSAIGDSLGAQREGTYGFKEVTEPGPVYTDDTAMMIAVAESLIECNGFDGAHMARLFVSSFEREPLRGYGAGPPRIFEMIKSGRKWDENPDRELYDGGSFGNGSAMRVAPVGLFYYNDPEKLREISCQSSRITHSHPLGMEGAALQAYAVSLAIREERDFPEKLKEFTRVDIYRKKMDALKELLDKLEDREQVVRELGNGIEAFNSVPTAIFSFLANSSFKEALIYAVSLGGDTDTIGAMTGAIAGAWWGIDSIPPEWKENLENRDYMEGLGMRIWETAMSSQKGLF